MTPVDPDLPIFCAPCFIDHRWSQAVAVVGGDSICQSCLDGYSARADVQLDAQEDQHAR